MAVWKAAGSAFAGRGAADSIDGGAVGGSGEAVCSAGDLSDCLANLHLGSKC